MDQRNVLSRVTGSLSQGLSQLAFVIATLFIDVGCSFNVHDSEALSESMAITFSQPDFWLEPESTLFWRSDLVFFFNDSRKKPKGIRPILQQEIQGYLTARTYRFTEDKNSARYGLVAVVVLGEGITAADILQQFKLTPSFKASNRYEKGTIVVAIFDAMTEKVLWRGALQANIDLGLSPKARQQRVREGIARLLSHVPQQKPEA
ncbi:MAG: DUF4136 domain-containing protein [Pseudomonadales bacterium]|nr:DUF4136 domain-containing protein [Pseudomonadales bacterium]